ncbi:MAG: CBS domain-containing protein, partial [Burkholderiaceae bacterium]|nr:CBS domain-containing protein [Burkholderiaceae bacterium]
MNTLTVAELVEDRRADELYRLPASASVAEATALMARREIGALLVMTEDGLVAGLFTERDLLVRVVAAGRDPASTPLSLVMTRDLKFVTPATSTEAALALMHLHRFRHLLVIDGPVVHGLVSMRDLVVQIVTRGEGRYESAVREA